MTDDIVKRARELAEVLDKFEEIFVVEEQHKGKGELIRAVLLRLEAAERVCEVLDGGGMYSAFVPYQAWRAIRDGGGK